MTEKRCATCQRYEDGSFVCGLTGVDVCHDDDGSNCRAYLERGRETVRVSVAVVVSEKGVWVAGEGLAIDRMVLGLGQCRSKLRGTTIEADVPLPETTTVEAFPSD